MAAAIVASGGGSVGKNLTFTGSGFSNATVYELTVISPSGKSHPKVTTDGSGAFTYVFTVQEGGNHSCEARPLAEVQRTTSAAATSNTVSSDGRGK